MIKLAVSVPMKAQENLLKMARTKVTTRKYYNTAKNSFQNKIVAPPYVKPPRYLPTQNRAAAKHKRKHPDKIERNKKQRSYKSFV